ncbi:TonB-dependent receptor [Candidatus Magnetomorum sp. HK-1]|nr:TonB-dependent receptor [Candidatus Magnetomorum sp. HK-1]
MKILIYMFFLPICFQIQAFANSDVQILDEITVSASQEESSEISTQIISSDKPGVVSVPDLLKNTSGLDIQCRSILTPKNSQIKIRGLDERRSQILLDGRTLNGTGVMGGFFVDWSSLSLLEFQNIEVKKGAFSAKYGNTLGGTINMISAMPKKGTQIKVYSGYKRYQTYQSGTTASFLTDKYHLSLMAGHNQTDGHLRNSQAKRNDFSLNFSLFSLKNQEIKINARFSDGEFNMPVENNIIHNNFDPEFPESIGSYLTGPGIQFINDHGHGDDSHFVKKRYELDLSYKYNISTMDLIARIFFNNEDRNETLFDCLDNKTILKRESIPDRSWGWRIDLNKTSDRNIVGVGVSGNYQGYGGTNNTFTVENYYKSLNDGFDEWDTTKRFGIYMDYQWQLFETIDIYGGLRYEIYKGDRTVDTAQAYTNGKPVSFKRNEVVFDETSLLPKLSITYNPMPDISFHGRIARATRFPDDPAFYWYYAGYQPEIDPRNDIIRTDLTYEDSMQYELGFTYKIKDALSIQTNAYYYHVDDYIRWIFGYPPSRLVYNIDHVDFSGIEFDIKGHLTDTFFYSSSFTYQKTKKHGDVMDASNDLESSLSELPDKKFNIGLSYLFKENMKAEINVRWVDKIYVPYGKNASPDGLPVGSNVILQELDDFTTIDVSLEIPIKFRQLTGTFTLAVENLFDITYQEEYGFPSPGQTMGLYLGMIY